MSTFDPTDYFARLSQQAAEQERVNPVQDKFQALQRASAEKIGILNKDITRLKQLELVNAGSLVGRMELDPEGIAGKATNLVASAYTGASRVAGDILGFAGADFEALVRDANLSEPEKQAIGKYWQGTASPEEVALINRSRGQGAYSPLQHAEKAREARQRSADINSAFDRSDTIHQGARSELSQQLGEGFQNAWGQTTKGAEALWTGEGDGRLSGAADLTAGLAKLVFNAGEASVTNPGAAAEYMAENAPQLVLGMAGKLGKVALTMSNVGYASEEYQKGVEKYQTENQGAYPPAELRTKMAAAAASLALAEQVGDLSILKGARGAADAAKETAKTGFLQSMKNIAGVAAKSYATEAATEGYQTFAEGQANLTPASPEQIYEGAVIGGMSGGGLAGSGRAVGEALKATPEHVAERVATATAKEVSKQAQEAAIASGDVSVLLDPKNAAYSPSNAVAALHGNSVAEGATEEVKKTNLDKAVEIVTRLEVTKDLIQSKVEKAKAEGSTVPAKEARSLQVQLERVDTELGLSTENLQRFTADQASKTMPALTKLVTDTVESTTEAGVTQVPASDPQTRKKAASSLIVLSMSAPDQLDVKTATAMADDTTLEISDTERTYLRQFSAARVAENKARTTEMVNQEVMVGSKKNIGLAQYKTMIGKALLSDNKREADRKLGLLRNFNKSQLGKATTAVEAWNLGWGTQIERTKTGEWVLSPEFRNKKFRDDNGGLELKSKKLLDGIKVESEAISAVLAELESAYAVKFGTAVNVSGSPANVKDVPQASPLPEAPAQEKQAGTDPKTAPVGAAEGTTPSDGGKAAVRGTAKVSVTPSSVTNSLEKQDESQRQGQEGLLKPTAEEAPAETTVSAVPPWDDLPDSAYVDETTTTAAEVTEGNSQTAQETPVAEKETTTESPEVTSEGKLSLFEENEEGNQVAVGFTQEPGREGDTTKRPLVMVKDFLDSLIDRAQEFAESKLTEDQYSVLDKFVNQARSWEGVLARNLPKRKAPEYRYEDVMQYLLKDPTRPGEKSDVDQNVLTAISYAVWNWVAAEASSPSVQDRKSVNRILGKKPEDWAGHKAYAVLGRAGSYQHWVIDSLGGDVLDALGLKAKGDTPLDLMPKLRMALGAHALKLMEDGGLVKRTTIGADVIAELRGNEVSPMDYYMDKGEEKFKPHYFIAIARQADGDTPVKGVLEIKEANKGSGGVLEKLFKVASGLRFPLLTPSNTLPRTTKGTEMLIPERLKEILLKNQTNGRKLRTDIVDLLDGLTEDQLSTVLGLQDATHLHEVNKHGAAAKNQALEREYNLLMEFIKEHLDRAPEGRDTPFYYEFSVWKQQRVGIATNVANPQSSKIARHMIFSPDWVVDIKSTDEVAMNSFFLRVAEGLGMKTERQDNKVSIEEIKATLATPEYDKGIQALRKKVVRGEAITAEEQAAIVAAVKKAGENLHSLDALIGVAQQQEAEKEGPYSFTVKMMGEVDGVANGTMLNHVLLGAGTTIDELQSMLHAGGFFQEGSEHTQYNMYRGTPGNLDIYESTVRDLHQAVQEFMRGSDGETVEKVKAIWDIAGNIFDEKAGTITRDGRNLVKDAMNPLAFGSSLKSVTEGMSRDFLANVYKGFEKMSADGATQAEVDVYVTTLNSLISSPKVRHLPVGLKLAEYMAMPLHKAYEAQLRKAFADTVGAVTTEVLESKFAVFLARRDALNNTANATFGISDAIYRGVRESYIEELIADGKIKLNAKGERTGDLTKKQEKELQKRTRFIDPLVQTSMSKLGDGRKAGLRMAKHKRKQNDAPEYENKTQFGTKLKTDKSSVTLHGLTTQQEEPGVAMGSALTHSTDSYISHMTQAMRDVLNVHDAVGDGVLGLQESARLMNQSTWQAMLGYSPLNEVHQSLSVVVRGLAHMLAKEQLPPQAVRNVQSYLYQLSEKQEIELKSIFESLLQGSKNTAYMADSTKLGMMANWVSVDQYAFQGGNYAVTPEDRAKAASDLKKLTTELGPKDKAALEVLAGFMKLKAETVKVTPVAQESNTEDESVLLDEDTNADTESIVDVDMEEFIPTKAPMPAVGTPKAAQNPELVAYFKESGERSAKEVLEKLLSMSGEKRSFQTELIKMIQGILPDDLKVKVITSATKSDEISVRPDKFVGYYYNKVAYVLNEEFEFGALHSPETLLHELVHGVLIDTVEQELADSAANPKYTSPALRQIRELQSLMAMVKSKLSDADATKYSSALEDVHEFIAYGMTQKSFQRALAQIKVKEAQDTNALGAFVRKLVGLLFAGSNKNQQERVNTALTQLVKNVADLVETVKGDPVALPLKPKASTSFDKVMNYTTQDIHEALDGGTISIGFNAKLQGLLGDIVHKLHGPFGAFKAGLMAQQTLTPQDVWLKALDTGVAPLALSVTASPIAASQKELHAMEQVEAVVRAALAERAVSTRAAFRELDALFVQMRDKIKPTDMKPGEHEFIFKTELDANGQSHHLARFAAFTLAHEGFNKLMQQATDRAPKERVMTVGDKIQRIFERFLAFFVEKMTHTFNGQKADEKLTTLVGQLVDIEAKRRFTILRNQNRSNPLEGLEKIVGKGTEKVRAGVAGLAGTKMIRESRSTQIQLAGALTRIVANDQVAHYMGVLRKFRDDSMPGLHGLPTQILTQIKGPGQMLNMLQLAATNMQRHRKEIISEVAKVALKAFANEGKDLTDSKAAISQVFMRSGMHVLVDTLDMAQLEKLMEDPKALKAAISETETELNKFPALARLITEYIHQANALGYFRVTGEAKHHTMMMNAHNITRLYGTAYTSRVTEQQAQMVEPIVERLVALYAMEYTSDSDRAKALAVLKTENARKDGNGVEFLLKMQKSLAQESKDALFKNQKALMTHGYTPEIYNEDTLVEVTTEADGKELIAHGFHMVHPVGIDPADPDKRQLFLYALRNGGLARYQSGIVSTTGKRSKGSTVHSGYLNVNTEDGIENLETNRQIAADKPSGLSSGPRPDLRKSKISYMVPVVNPQGMIVNWRYLMHDKTKDTVLERDNRFEHILGAYAGSIFDKVGTTQQNRVAIQALAEQFQKEQFKEANAYVLVGPSSAEPELRQAWDLLPDESKAAARAAFGTDGMRVKKEMLLPVFGFRKYSLSEAFHKDHKSRTHLEKALVLGIQHLLSAYYRVEALKKGVAITREEAISKSRKAAVLITRFEKGWQEVVGEVKDIIVIKSISVFIDNVFSNLSLLALSGVPLASIARDHLVALKAATKYEEDREDLAELEMLVKTGMLHTRPNAKAEIARLKDSMNRNPVKDMIDAGLMPTIVEDVAMDDDPYSYKSALSKKVQKYTDKMNPKVLIATKWLYMAHDTKGYQMLSRVTRLSDFVARYTLYQHLTSRKNNPLGREAALNEASEAFINYDSPLPKQMDYLDGMGIMPFMKYYMRVQRILIKLVRENPARVLGTLLLNNLVDLGPIVLDSSWVHKVGNNPFQMGAVNWFTSIDDIGPIAGALAIVK